MAMTTTETGDAVQGQLTNGNQDPGGSGQTGETSSIVRDPGEIPEARAALVKAWSATVRSDKKRWEPDFKRIREDQDFLIGRQYAGSTDDEDRYVANITLRHVNLRVSSIYAKNPTVVCKRRDSMDFLVWDETPESVKQAMAAMQGAQAGGPAAASDPNVQAVMAQAQALMKDIQQGMQKRTVLGKVARTLELYFKNRVLPNQFPPFKMSMKQLVRRVEACGIGYIQLDLMRAMELSPDQTTRITTIDEQLATVNTILADMKDGDPLLTQTSAEAEELRLVLAQIHSSPDVVKQEGIVFDFPSSTSIIPDGKVTHLPGWAGADHVTREYMMTTDQVKDIYKVDVGNAYTAFTPSTEHWSSYIRTGTGRDEGGKFKKGLVCVWRVFSRKDGLVFTIADGYRDFLEEPAAPKLKLERFYPWFVLAFNLTEHDDKKYPVSDVRLLKHPQREYNRARQGKREHRLANRPMTAIAAGAVTDEDKQKLQDRPANAVVTLNSLAQGQKIDDILQPVKGVPITPELYDVEEAFSDVLRIAGSQEANLGGTSGATATESSIAEGSRISSLQSNIDDQDDFLTEVMHAAGQVALKEIGPEEVKKYVGPGAVWPELSTQDVADELYLEVRAGSSGRPNRAAEIQNFTQMMPFMLQMPDLNPTWILREALRRLDDNLDVTEAISVGHLSIQAMNAAAGKPLGQPATGGKPSEAQGPKGATPVGPGPQPGAQLGPQTPNDLSVGGSPMGNA
jgi:hypothetical protein